VDSDLDDIEDFMEAATNQDCYPLREQEQGLSIPRKQVRLCRHKLQTRAYPKLAKKKAWRSPENNLEPENQDLEHEWFQLVQMEKAIEKRRNQLREAEAGDRGETETDDRPFDENEEDLAKLSENLEDGDLEYINSILNSFSSPTCDRQSSSQLKLKSITEEDAPARAWTSQTTPPKFNLTFNQNSTTLSSEEDHFSYFSSAVDGSDDELGDYFSDDEEEDIGDSQD